VLKEILGSLEILELTLLCKGILAYREILEQILLSLEILELMETLGFKETPELILQFKAIQGLPEIPEHRVILEQLEIPEHTATLGFRETLALILL